MTTPDDPLLNASYHCAICDHTHNTASRIGREHRRYAVATSTLRELGQRSSGKADGEDAK